MFDVGEFIVYGKNGICKVVDITHPDIAGSDNERLYYVLVPERTRDTKLYCPADNDKIAIRRIVTAEEAKQILNESQDISPLVVENERNRDDSYKTVMKSSDLRQWIQIVKALLIRKKQREESGKKITLTDERYLKMAEEGLYSELALATGYDVEMIKEQIVGALI